MIIDVHTHVWNKKIWDDYNKRSQGKINKIITLPWCKKGDIKDWLCVEELFKFTATKPTLYATGSIDMEKSIEPQLENHEKLFKQSKIVAIKLYPGYQHFYPSNPKVAPIAKLCEKYNEPLIFHSGDVYDLKGVALLKYSHPSYIDELANNFPKTKIIISHFGFPFLLETANIVSKNKNVYTDISGTIYDCGSDKDIERLKKQYITDLQRVFNYFPNVKNKVMFATDYMGENTELNRVIPYLDVVKKVLNTKEQECAFHLLAEKLYFNE